MVTDESPAIAQPSEKALPHNCAENGNDDDYQQEKRKMDFAKPTTTKKNTSKEKPCHTYVFPQLQKFAAVPPVLVVRVVALLCCVFLLVSVTHSLTGAVDTTLRSAGSSVGSGMGQRLGYTLGTQVMSRLFTTTVTTTAAPIAIADLAMTADMIQRAWGIMRSFHR